jgi:hypothetical protein
MHATEGQCTECFGTEGKRQSEQLILLKWVVYEQDVKASAAFTWLLQTSSVIWREFIDQLHNYQLLKRDSSP